MKLFLRSLFYSASLFASLQASSFTPTFLPIYRASSGAYIDGQLFVIGWGGLHRVDTTTSPGTIVRIDSDMLQGGFTGAVGTWHGQPAIFSDFYGIMLSSDHGITWTRMASQQLNPNDYMALRVDAVLLADSVISILTEDSLYQLQGSAWTKHAVPTQLDNAKLFRFHDTLVYSGLDEKAYATTNAGASWQKYPTADSTYDMLTCTQDTFLVQAKKIQVRNHGSWQIASMGDFSTVMSAVCAEDKIVLMFNMGTSNGNDLRKVQSSADSGRTWIDNSIGTSPFLYGDHLLQIGATAIMWKGLEGIYRTIDGTTWNLFAQGSGNAILRESVLTSDGVLARRYYANPYLYVSEDSAKSWKRIQVDTTRGWAGIQAVGTQIQMIFADGRLTSINPHTGVSTTVANPIYTKASFFYGGHYLNLVDGQYFANSLNNLLHSSDSGKTWNVVFDTLDGSNSFYPQLPAPWLCTSTRTSSTLCSGNAGTTWKNITSSTAFPHSYSSVYAVSLLGDSLLLSAAQDEKYNSDTLYLSHDTGSSWMPIHWTQAGYEIRSVFSRGDVRVLTGQYYDADNVQHSAVFVQKNGGTIVGPIAIEYIPNDVQRWGEILFLHSPTGGCLVLHSDGTPVGTSILKQQPRMQQSPHVSMVTPGIHLVQAQPGSSISIIDLQGQQLRRIIVPSTGLATIDLRGMSAGIYLLQGK